MLSYMVILEITTDSNSLRNFSQSMGLIRMAWEKLNVCLSSNIWKKRMFQLSFVMIDCLYLLILFSRLRWVSPMVMFVAIFAWDGVYACVRDSFMVGSF